jgi:hypothetical protein
MSMIHLKAHQAKTLNRGKQKATAAAAAALLPSS